MTSLELDLLSAVQESPFPGITVPNLIREATQTEYDVVVGALLALALWRSGSPRAAVVLVVLLVVLPFSQTGLKLLVNRARPPYDADVLWSEPSSPSFPSGHVMSATVVYGWLLWWTLFDSWDRRWRLAAGALAATVLLMTAVTSVYLAVHWPSDVLGGYLWGLTLLLPAIWFAKAKAIVKCEAKPGRRE